MRATNRLFFLLTCQAALSAHAAPTVPAPGPAQGPTQGPTMSHQDPCRNQVSKFEQSIGLVRQTSGQKAASDLKEKLLPAKVESDILFKDGYCGLAAHLKNRKLID